MAAFRHFTPTRLGLKQAGTTHPSATIFFPNSRKSVRELRNSPAKNIQFIIEILNAMLCFSTNVQYPPLKGYGFLGHV